MSKCICTLEPKAIWENFYKLTQVPRPSNHEEKAREFVMNWAKENGIHAEMDEANNILLSKPATPGMENRKGVILQGHLDMVPQKNEDKQHDFTKDPIEAYIDGEWVTADGTTLGADNGIGVAAELIEVQPEYVVAIETALGGAAQNLVMGSSEAAKKAISYLKQRQAGRATFLPLDTIKYYERRSEEEALAKLPGIRGFAADLIGYDIKLAPIFKFLLGRVLVADNMDAALAAAKKSSFRTRVVTLAGDVVNAGGSLTGGSRQQKEAGFLSRGKEIDEQEKKAGVLRRELLGYQELLEEHEGTLKVYNNKLVELRQDLQQKEIRKAELGVALERLSAEQRQAGASAG